ncbi:hypothetical protein IKX12_01590 [Candidatus Saccharibacteria bacterium]|nr:hypothetical protein [Candidatus Saccharibacteria bacterium]
MAILFGSHVTEESYQAFNRLVDLTAKINLTKKDKCPVSFEDAKRAHLEDSTFPDPNSLARIASFSEFSEASKAAFKVWQRSLPDEEEPEETTPEAKPEAEPEVESETKSEVEPDVEPKGEEEEELPPPPFNPETDAPDPFDGDPVILVAPNEEVADSNENAEEESIEPADPTEVKPPIMNEGNGEFIKLYSSASLSSNPLLPQYTLVNYLFMRRACIIDPRFEDGKRSFYSEETGFHAAVSRSDKPVTTEEIFLIDSEGGEIPNAILVEQTGYRTELELIGFTNGKLINMPFPGRSNGKFYLVSEEFARAARETGRTTDDLFFVSDGDYIDGDRTNEVIIRKLRKL